MIDILLVAGIFYGIFYLTRGTQAVQLLRGMVVVALIAVLVAKFLQLTAFNWLIRNSFQALLISIPVVFQPELRRALERLGRLGVVLNRPSNQTEATQMISQISRSAQQLSEKRHGALIVIERDTGLQEIIETGVPIQAIVTADLLTTIFWPKTALHDGAVIIRGRQIVAAACVLPLAETSLQDRGLGTRHMAGLGITQRTDAVAVIVSEETGIISLAINGRIVRNLDEGRLNRVLQNLINPQFTPKRWPTMLQRLTTQREIERGAETISEPKVPAGPRGSSSLSKDA